MHNVVELKWQQKSELLHVAIKYPIKISCTQQHWCLWMINFKPVLFNLMRVWDDLFNSAKMTALQRVKLRVKDADRKWHRRCGVSWYRLCAIKPYIFVKGYADFFRQHMTAEEREQLRLTNSASAAKRRARLRISTGRNIKNFNSYHKVKRKRRLEADQRVYNDAICEPASPMYAHK